MKKLLCVIAAVSMLVAVQAQEATMDDDVGTIGIGYQGMVLGDLLNGIAVRGKPAPIGWQVELLQGMAELDPSGGTATEADLIILKGKGYYALVERDNSTLYAGASLGYWMAEIDPGGGSTDIDGFSVAPLVGVEWNFAELEELGFNFEVSYEIDMLEADAGGGSDADITLSGVTIATGVAYYF